MASDGDFHLQGLDGQRHPSPGPHFQAKRDGFTDIFQSFVACLSLAHATGNGGAFRDPATVFIPLEGGHEFHKQDTNRLPSERKQSEPFSHFVRKLRNARLSVNRVPFKTGQLSKKAQVCDGWLGGLQTRRHPRQLDRRHGGIGSRTGARAPGNFASPCAHGLAGNFLAAKPERFGKSRRNHCAGRSQCRGSVWAGSHSTVGISGKCAGNGCGDARKTGHGARGKRPPR